MTASHALSQLSYSPGTRIALPLAPWLCGVNSGAEQLLRLEAPASCMTHKVDSHGPDFLPCGMRVFLCRSMAVALLCWGSACGEIEAVDLLELEGVYPSRLASGDTLQVRGVGLREGPGTLTIEGLHLSPDGRSQPVHLVLNAVNKGRVLTVPWSEATLASIGGGGTFKGSMVVSQTLSGKQVQLRGRLPELQIDLAPSVRERVRAERSGRRSRAIDFHTSLGLSTQFDSTGLKIVGVDEGSPAFAAGLRVGDVVSKCNHAFVTYPYQCSLTATGDAPLLEVQRSTARPFTLQLQGAKQGLFDLQTKWLVFLLLCAIAVVSFSLGGLRGIADRLRSHVRSALRGLQEAGTKRGFINALVIVLVASLLSMGAQSLGSNDPLLLYWSLLVCFALAVHAGLKPRLSRVHFWYRLLRDVPLVFVSMVACVLALHGDVRFRELSDVASLPWELGAFATPATTGSLLVFLIAMRGIAGTFQVQGTQFHPFIICTAKTLFAFVLVKLWFGSDQLVLTGGVQPFVLEVPLAARVSGVSVLLLLSDQALAKAKTRIPVEWVAVVVLSALEVCRYNDWVGSWFFELLPIAVTALCSSLVVVVSARQLRSAQLAWKARRARKYHPPVSPSNMASASLYSR